MEANRLMGQTAFHEHFLARRTVPTPGPSCLLGLGVVLGAPHHQTGDTGPCFEGLLLPWLLVQAASGWGVEVGTCTGLALPTSQPAPRARVFPAAPAATDPV